MKRIMQRAGPRGTAAAAGIAGVLAIAWGCTTTAEPSLAPTPTATPTTAGAADVPSPTPTPTIPPYEIVSLLPKDAIPAIMESEVRYLEGEDANAQMQMSDRILGVSINGDHRAFSTAQLSSHEVVNDTIGGLPVAVTW